MLVYSTNTEIQEKINSDINMSSLSRKTDYEIMLSMFKIKNNQNTSVLSLNDILKRKRTFLEYLKKSGMYIFIYDWSDNRNGDFSVYANINTDGNINYTITENENTHYIVDENFINEHISYYYDIQDISINEDDTFESRMKDINRFNDAVNYRIADYYVKKDYPHKSVLWALHNCNDYNWNISKTVTENTIKTTESIDFLYKLNKLKLKKQIDLFLIENPTYSSIYREVTFENWSGIHGYTDYELKEMRVTGFKVTCWSSYQFGGNCNCINHTPYEDIDRELYESDFEYIKNIYKTFKHGNN